MEAEINQRKAHTLAALEVDKETASPDSAVARSMAAEADRVDKVEAEMNRRTARTLAAWDLAGRLQGEGNTWPAISSRPRSWRR